MSALSAINLGLVLDVSRVGPYNYMGIIEILSKNTNPNTDLNSDPNPNLDHNKARKSQLTFFSNVCLNYN